jgi:hypothetical protein
VEHHVGFPASALLSRSQASNLRRVPARMRHYIDLTRIADAS